MSDTPRAAREGDALSHTSLMADALGGFLEVAANVAIGGLLTAAVIGATGLTVMSGGLGGCVLGVVVGVAVGVGMEATGADTRIGQFCEDLANDLFAPTTQAHISTGSANTFINGLPEHLTDSDGHSLWRARYRVWGNSFEEISAPHCIEEQNLRFQGQYLDRETGLHFNTFRFYDPDIGRFTTPDPIGLAGGLNLYAYAPNPIGWVDPWGWSCVRVRHYTNRKGLEGIKASGVIKARDNNRVYLEPAHKKPLSAQKAQDKYEIGDGKGRDFVETDVQESQLKWVKNPRYHRLELTVKGDLKLQNPTFIQRK